MKAQYDVEKVVRGLSRCSMCGHQQQDEYILGTTKYNILKVLEKEERNKLQLQDGSNGIPSLQIISENMKNYEFYFDLQQLCLDAVISILAIGYQLVLASQLCSFNL